MTERIVEAEGLVKRYGKVITLDGLDLVAEPGHVLAVLGPNGAGKTTFVRTIATLLRPDGGSLRVAGHDVRREPEAVRRLIGLAGQFAAVEPALSGRENLEMVARLFGQDRRAARANSAEVLDRLGLAEDGDRLVRTYSGGMRRKLDLGASLVGSPRLLLLDEPTTGLDPRSRVELWDAIRSMVERGTDILLTTQYLEEADQLAGRVVIIDHGRAVASGTPSELKRASAATSSRCTFGTEWSSRWSRTRSPGSARASPRSTRRRVGSAFGSRPERTRSERPSVRSTPWASRLTTWRFVRRPWTRCSSR